MEDASSGGAAEEWRPRGEAGWRHYITRMTWPRRSAPLSVAALLLLAGCAGGSPASRDACRDAGHAPGSQAFAACLAAAERDAQLGSNDRPY